MPEDGPGLFELSPGRSGRFEPARLTQARARLGVSEVLSEQGGDGVKLCEDERVGLAGHPHQPRLRQGGV